MRYSAFRFSQYNIGQLPTAYCILLTASCAERRRLGALRHSVPLVVFVLLAASGCSYLKPHLTATELSERLQYSHDRALEELVGITMAHGYRAVNGEGQARQVLELNHSNPGAIHRQFFEVQPRDEGLSEVFFLENKGSVDRTQFSRFPRHLRQAIREFLEGLPEARSEEYRPLLIRQGKAVTFDDHIRNEQRRRGLLNSLRRLRL